MLRALTSVCVAKCCKVSTWQARAGVSGRYLESRSSCALQDNTAGTFDERLYRYGVSLQAQMPRDYEGCYRAPIEHGT